MIIVVYTCLKLHDLFVRDFIQGWFKNRRCWKTVFKVNFLLLFLWSCKLTPDISCSVDCSYYKRPEFCPAIYVTLSKCKDTKIKSEAQLSKIDNDLRQMIKIPFKCLGFKKEKWSEPLEGQIIKPVQWAGNCTTNLFNHTGADV